MTGSKNGGALRHAGSLKINVDGTFIPSAGAAAVGVVIRDHAGQAKLASWRVLSYCRDAEEAEAAACREGITLAARLAAYSYDVGN